MQGRFHGVGQLLRQADQGVHVDPRFHLHQPEHVGQVFSRYVARSVRREGASPDAAQRTVQHGGARLHRGQGVGEAHAARVVEMDDEALLRPAAAKLAHHARHPRGVAHAHRIAQEKLVHAQPDVFFGDVVDHLFRHAPGVGTPRRQADRPAEGNPRALHDLGDFGHLLQALLDGAVHVRAVVHVRDGDDLLHPVAPCVHRPSRAALVGDEALIGHARLSLDAAHHLVRVRRGGHRLGVHEARGLDAADACVRQAFDDLDLQFGGQHLLQVLDAVAHDNVAHENARRKLGVRHGRYPPAGGATRPDASFSGRARRAASRPEGSHSTP